MDEQQQKQEQQGQSGSGTPPTPPVLTEEQWVLAFEHPRFKELAKRAKDAEAALEKRNTDDATAEQDRLKEQQRYKELWEKAEADRKAAQEEADRIRAERVMEAKHTAIREVARANGFGQQAAADAPLFVDLSAIPMGEDGQPVKAEVERAVKALAQARPYLLDNARRDPGSPPNRRQPGLNERQPAQPERRLTL